MYYTPKERVDIGRRVFARELTQQDAARQYGVSQQSIVNYVRKYMKGEGIPRLPKP